MKKIFLLAFVAIFGFYSAGSVNWYPYIDQPPCSTNPDQTAWGSPIEFKLCFEQPCNKCCFTIIYFDRWIGGNPPPINEIFVAGIFHDGNSCCGYYSDAAVVDEFFKQLFYNKSKDNNDFYNQVTYGGMHTAWLSVKGKCVVSEESCGTICCGTPIELNFETIDDIHTVHQSTYKTVPDFIFLNAILRLKIVYQTVQYITKALNLYFVHSHVIQTIGEILKNK